MKTVESFEIVDARRWKSVEFLSEEYIPLNHWEYIPYTVHLDPTMYIMLAHRQTRWIYVYNWWPGKREGWGEESRQTTPHRVYVFKVAVETLTAAGWVLADEEGHPPTTGLWKTILRHYLENGGSITPPLEFWRFPEHGYIHNPRIEIREVG